ncbi:MAG: redoxin domain-containing protein [Planctomycetaceae bacterium]|nr:redoxin domain-containing protein [Planctomycetaceae bacterium]
MAALVNHQAPNFTLDSIEWANLSERTVQLADYSGSWLILIFYPRDFSFVCPTELIAFSAEIGEFQKRDCQLLGISVDSLELHREWLTTPREKGGLGPLQFPLASDGLGQTARAYGVWDGEKRVAQRGLFIIDPDGILQYSVIHNLSVGRGATEILRVVDALQTGGLCPATWTAADGTIDAESVLKPGQVLGHYRVKRLLGDGTFGSVFAAWDLRLHRDVAIKILKRDLTTSREALLAEARSAARLSHPNICTIYSVDEEAGLPSIAMEYLPGQHLGDLLKHPLSEARARSLAGQIATGMASAHQQNIVHGDLKPANVMVMPNDLVKILDFGLARTYRARNSPKGTAVVGQSGGQTMITELPEDDDPTTIIQFEQIAGKSEEDSFDVEETLLENDGRAFGLTGTPAYMSPEQCHGHPATPQSDVFSLGLILFESLMGHRAMSENNLLHLLLHLQEETLAEELAAQVPPAYQPLLSKMLAYDPALRPSMRTIESQLNQS